jgi:hypothetical protein
MSLRMLIKALLPAMLLMAPAVTSAAEQYLNVRIDEAGHLRLITAEGVEVLPPLDREDPENVQVGFAKPALSADGTTVGWLALYPNCCTSYPIPLELVLFKNGQVFRRFRGDGLPIWAWRFEASDQQVAIEQEPTHGGNGVHFEIRDIESGRLIDQHDGKAALQAPQWIQDVAH